MSNFATRDDATIGMAHQATNRPVRGNRDLRLRRTTVNHRLIAILRCEARRHALCLATVSTLISLLLLGCADTPTSPSDTALATIGVGTEVFRVQLVGRAQIDAARAAQRGGNARIPLGRIVAGTGVNTGWTWHLVDIEFVEAAIELCDGRPSDIEREGIGFGGGRFCPWNARVLGISQD